ncbi:MAG: hypothetical protein JWM11_1479 [Planctomycetaceae bacterium]|nr:hypothetical protein [Planctomycetaceae bacterium]
MNLTIEQIEAVKDGELVRIADSEIGFDCVVLRADVYERVKTRAADCSDPRETYAAVLKVLDANDESTDQYLEYLDD